MAKKSSPKKSLKAKFDEAYVKMKDERRAGRAKEKSKKCDCGK